jgi:hypothetical protein
VGIGNPRRIGGALPRSVPNASGADTLDCEPLPHVLSVRSQLTICVHVRGHSIGHDSSCDGVTYGRSVLKKALV